MATGNDEIKSENAVSNPIAVRAPNDDAIEADNNGLGPSEGGTLPNQIVNNLLASSPTPRGHKFVPPTSAMPLSTKTRVISQGVDSISSTPDDMRTTVALVINTTVESQVSSHTSEHGMSSAMALASNAPTIGKYTSNNVSQAPTPTMATGADWHMPPHQSANFPYGCTPPTNSHWLATSPIGPSYMRSMNGNTSADHQRMMSPGGTQPMGALHVGAPTAPPSFVPQMPTPTSDTMYGTSPLSAMAQATPMSYGTPGNQAQFFPNPFAMQPTNMQTTQSQSALVGAFQNMQLGGDMSRVSSSTTQPPPSLTPQFSAGYAMPTPQHAGPPQMSPGGIQFDPTRSAFSDYGSEATVHPCADQPQWSTMGDIQFPPQSVHRSVIPSGQRQMFGAPPPGLTPQYSMPPPSQPPPPTPGAMPFGGMPPMGRMPPTPNAPYSMLDEIKTNGVNARVSIDELVARIREVAVDQHGSRFIQSKLESASPMDKERLFAAIRPHVRTLTEDVFGNYVISKLFERGGLEQRQQLVELMRGHVLPMTLHMYGCRVIQKAIECLPTVPMQLAIIEELRGKEMKCIKDQNGNHVVQKIVEKVPSVELDFLLDAIHRPSTGPSQVYALATHPYGCRVIQRVLERCNEAQTRPVLDELHAHVDTLVTDQFGNYVVQHILEHGHHDDRARVVRAMHGKVFSLSQHKYASNVIEKCLTKGDKANVEVLIKEVIAGEDNGEQVLEKMMHDQFANYVIQKMFDVADNELKKAIIIAIKPYIAQLKRFAYGKHIMNKLERWLQKQPNVSQSMQHVHGVVAQGGAQSPINFGGYGDMAPASNAARDGTLAWAEHEQRQQRAAAGQAMPPPPAYMNGQPPPPHNFSAYH